MQRVASGIMGELINGSLPHPPLFRPRPFALPLCLTHAHACPLTSCCAMASVDTVTCCFSALLPACTRGLIQHTYDQLHILADHTWPLPLTVVDSCSQPASCRSTHHTHPWKCLRPAASAFHLCSRRFSCFFMPPPLLFNTSGGWPLQSACW